MSELDRRVAEVAARQHNLITRSQVVAFGATDRAIDQRVSNSRWQPMQPSVWLVAPAAPTWLQRQHAACLATGPWAATSHRAACALWGLDGVNEGVVETTVPMGHHPKLAGVVLHRTQRFDPVDLTVHRGVPVTTVTRTLVDLGAVVPPLVVERALEDAFRRGMTSEGAIVRRLAEIGGRGCRGVGVMRDVLGRRIGGRPRSGAEVILGDLLREAGIAGLVRSYVVELNGERVEVDLAIPNRKIAIEFDSMTYHMRVRDFERGSRRNAILAALGWLVIPVIWDDLVRFPDRVVARVLLAIANTVPIPA